MKNIPVWALGVSGAVLLVLSFPIKYALDSAHLTDLSRLLGFVLLLVFLVLRARGK